MVHLVAFLQPAEDADGVLDGGFADVDLLEAALECGVLLHVLAVLLEGGGADEAQFTAGEHGLDHVAGVHGGVAGGSGADDGVQLVDEGDDLPVGVLDLVEHRLEALLELAAVLRAGDHGSQVEADQGFAAQGLGHVAGDNAAGQALDDGGLAHAGFADEHRVVLGAAGQDLHDAADLGVTADDGVDLAFAGELGQVGGVLLQGLELPLGILGGDLGGAAHCGEGALDGVVGRAVLLQQVGGFAGAAGDSGEQYLGGDVFVAEFAGELLGRGERVEGVPVEVRVRQVRALGLRVTGDEGPRLGEDGVGVGARGLEDRGGDAVGLVEDGDEQVGGPDVGVAVGGGCLQGGLHRLLGLGGGGERTHVLRLSLLLPCRFCRELFCRRSTLVFARGPAFHSVQRHKG